MDKDKLSQIAEQYNRLKGAKGTSANKVRITRKESNEGGETRSITGSINGSSCITLETWDYNGNLISDYYGYVSDYDGCFVCLGIDMGYISNYLGVSANDIIGIAIEIFAYTFGNDIGYEVYIDDILEHIEPEIIDGYIYFPVFTEGESQKDGVEIWPLSNYDGEIYFDAYDIEVHYSIRSPLTSIAIETEPTKISYNEGEQFDPTGMVVKAYYSDGTSQTITDYNYSPGGALTLGDREIIVSYQGKTTTQEIMVFSLSPDEPDYKQTYIDGKTGERVGYVTNPRNGRVDFAVDVLSLGGSLAPMSLSLVYNPYYRGYSFEKNFSEGWKLNVEQFIYLSGNDYIYVDENYRQHIFRKLVSDGSVYYDTEHTGLLLRIISGAKKITDDRGNELLFDSSGYLTTIKTTKGQNPITTIITYDGNHKLTGITDGMGRTATVNDSLITAPNGLKTNVMNSGITYFRGIAPNETVIETLTFSYKCGSLIDRVVSSNGEKSEFSYAGKAVCAITESVNDNVRKITELTYHQYKGINYYTEVKNSVYVCNGLSSQISRAYISTGDGHALLQNEVRNAADRQRLMSFRFASIEDYERLTLNLNPKKNAYGQEYGARDGFFSELDDVEDSESLVFYAVLDCDEFFDENGSVTIGLWDITTSNHLEGTELTFTGAMHGIKVLSKKVNIDGYSVNNIWYYVEENGYDIFSNFSPEAVHLCYSPRIKQGNCVQGSFGPSDLRYTEHGAAGDTVWSLLEKCTLYEGNAEKGKLTASDIALNEENAARASSNSSFIVWYEDLSKAILSNLGEVKCNDEENNISLATARFGILTIEETKNTFSHRAF
ncbi:MAG: bacterial Ig-like domain-containing protein, partial [Clostridia bacterium]|nr:bacterial Ig-like domain-containing protein [Clostridia bacterium]